MITAIIDAGQHYCQAVSDLWQWDYGQTLRIQGVKLPAAVEIQFSTTERIGETVTRIGVTQEGVTEVPVPDTLLEGGGTTQDYTIYAFVYIENGDSGKTEYRVSMKVRARPKPEAHATPEEGELFRQAIVAVAESADRAESARKSAETAADREVAEAASKAAQVSAISAEKSAERAETAKEEIQESADQIQKNATEIDSLKENKITKPAEAPTIGKILRVKSVNEDGTFVCEWADSGGSNLDVRIAGESIVQDGVAEIPKADTNTHNLGLIRVNAGNGFAVSADGTLNIIECTDDSLKKRYARIVSGNVIDYAVKAAMCDGKGTAWTADEQTAARERMGAWTGDWQIIMDETLAELTQEVSFEVPDDTKEMICYFKSGAAPKNAQVYLRTSNNGSSIAESFTSFGGSLSNNTISIGCQKIQFLNSQYGLIEYSYLSHSTPSSADYVQRAGKPSLLRIDSKRFAFHSVDINGGYPVETRLLVLVRR